MGIESEKTVRAVAAPNTIDFALTYDCNLRCSHCNLFGGKASEYEMTTSEVLEVLNQIAALDVFQMYIQGGEPLVRKDFWDILHYAADNLDLLININSNGLLWGEEEPDFLANNNFTVVFSIYEDQIKNPEIYADLKKTIGRLISRGVKVSINYLLTAQNMGSVLHRYQELYPLGLSSFIVIKYAPVGRGFTNDNLKIEYSVWESFFVSISHQKEKGKLPGFGLLLTSPWEFYLPFLKESEERISFLENLWRYQSPLRGHIYSNYHEISCVGGITNLFIGPDGYVYPCGLIGRNDQVILGNIRETPLRTIWEKSIQINEIRKISLNHIGEPCTSCALSKICGGGCRGVALSVKGNFLAPDPCCPLVQEYYKGG